MCGMTGLQVAIMAMGGSAWEVRNAASLIFTALLIRMLGFRNLVKVCNLVPDHDWCICPCLCLACCPLLSAPALDPAPTVVPASAHVFALAYAAALVHAFTLAFAPNLSMPLPLPMLQPLPVPLFSATSCHSYTNRHSLMLYNCASATCKKPAGLDL